MIWQVLFVGNASKKMIWRVLVVGNVTNLVTWRMFEMITVKTIAESINFEGVYTLIRAD